MTKKNQAAPTDLMDIQYIFHRLVALSNFLDIDPAAVVREACPDWNAANIALFLKGGVFYQETVSAVSDRIAKVLRDREIDFWLFELKGLGISQQEARERLGCKGWNRTRLYSKKDDFMILINSEKNRLQINDCFHRLQKRTFQNIVNAYIFLFSDLRIPLRQTEISEKLGVSQTVISKLQNNDTLFQFRYLKCIEDHLLKIKPFYPLYYASAYLNYRLNYARFSMRVFMDYKELFLVDSRFLYQCDPFHHDDVLGQKELIQRDKPDYYTSYPLLPSDCGTLFVGNSFMQEQLEYLLDRLVLFDLKTQELLLKAPHIFFDTVLSFTDTNEKKCSLSLFMLFRQFTQSDKELLAENLRDSHCCISDLLLEEDASVLLHEYFFIQNYRKTQTIQAVSNPDRLSDETISTQRERFLNTLKNYYYKTDYVITSSAFLSYIRSLLMMQPAELKLWILYRLKYIFDRESCCLAYQSYTEETEQNRQRHNSFRQKYDI